MKIESILGIMLISLMFPTTMAASANANDITPPSIVSFNFNPKVVDISNSPQNITFTVRLKDDLSGISDGEIGGTAYLPSRARFYNEQTGNDYLTVEFRSPSNDPMLNKSNLVYGNNSNGIYINNMVVPKDADIGYWDLEYFTVIDEAGNSRDYDQYEMFDMGFPIKFFVDYGNFYL